MVVIAPSDMNQVKKATLTVAAMPGGAYIRTCREKMPIFTTEDTPFEVGKANIYRDGKDVAIFACGEVVYESLKAAEELAKEGIEAAVIDNHSIKPIDEQTIIDYAKKTNLIVTVEDHQVNGGMGSAVAEVASSQCPVTVVRHGVYDRFCESGGAKELLTKYKLDAAGIKEVVKKAVEEKN
jgi:transketolase